MTKLDKLFHVVGAVAGTLVVAHATGQAAWLPEWAVGVLGVFAYSFGAVASKPGLGGGHPAAPPAPPAPPPA